MGSLQSQEARLNRSDEKHEEKAYHVKGETSNQKHEQGEASSRGRGRGGHRGKGGRGRGWGNVQQSENQRGNKQNIECYNCKHSGHVKANCWSKEKQAGYAEWEEEELKLFMEHHEDSSIPKHIWFLDSGCSNHMTGRSWFKEIDESYKLKVRLGDDKQIQVEGKGTDAIDDNYGNTKLLYNVYFIPTLSQNLLSVG